jgi:hypothetical protein
MPLTLLALAALLAPGWLAFLSLGFAGWIILVLWAGILLALPPAPKAPKGGAL